MADDVFLAGHWKDEDEEGKGEVVANNHKDESGGS